MKATTNFSVSSVSGKDDTINFLSDKDIQLIKGKFCSETLFADSPTELFKGLDFSYNSEKHLNIRKMLRNSSNPNEKYFNVDSKKFDYIEINKNFELISKVPVIDSRGNQSGIYLITLKLKSRNYIHFYFDHSKVKSILNVAKGETIKS